ncbi:MAG: hypothetical protein N4A35_12365 [Flavobacteriales bacterium]|jgi:hypothetical protein|nr:hypothetical protein [Flavobacteriales bacterium]
MKIVTKTFILLIFSFSLFHCFSQVEKDTILLSNFIYLKGPEFIKVGDDSGYFWSDFIVDKKFNFKKCHKHQFILFSDSHENLASLSTLIDYKTIKPLSKKEFEQYVDVLNYKTFNKKCYSKFKKHPISATKVIVMKMPVTEIGIPKALRSHCSFLYSKFPGVIYIAIGVI